MVHATLLLAYSKQPCVCYKVNICCTCCIIPSFQKFLLLSDMMCDHNVTLTLSPQKIKIKEEKIKNKKIK